ncbi:MAG TPA: DsbE family thiol:disulfide interchange protein [Sphingomonas sp.]|nr:DsbE family thiol:disulfide interchange protein [Sphingomonas sp.]
MSERLKWLPLIAFVLLGSALTYGLAKPNDTNITSKMIGVSVPAFKLPPATAGVPGLSNTDLTTGEPHLVNIFASWCVPCIAEAPQLKAIADAGVPVVGIAVRDRPEAVARFLARHGNPFRAIGSDSMSRVQMALGSSGVPESFVVDGKGNIRQQTIGPINPQDVAGVIAAVRDAR